jgi:hypothetical protein
VSDIDHGGLVDADEPARIEALFEFGVFRTRRSASREPRSISRLAALSAATRHDG